MYGCAGDCASAEIEKSYSFRLGKVPLKVTERLKKKDEI